MRHTLPLHTSPDGPRVNLLGVRFLSIRGTIRDRMLAPGASTPWHVTRCFRGRGT
jgi:hypothetical protein